MTGKRGVVSVGDDRWNFPRAEWGSLDWRREAQAERERAALPPVSVPRHVFGGGFSLFPAEPSAGRDERSRSADAALDRLGIRPRSAPRKPAVRRAVVLPVDGRPIRRALGHVLAVR